MPAALLIIDIQYDFLPPDGSLAVAGGLDVLPPTYRLLDDASWDLVIASQVRSVVLKSTRSCTSYQHALYSHRIITLPLTFHSRPDMVVRRSPPLKYHYRKKSEEAPKYKSCGRIIVLRVPTEPRLSRECRNGWTRLEPKS